MLQRSLMERSSNVLKPLGSNLQPSNARPSAKHVEIITRLTRVERVTGEKTIKDTKQGLTPPSEDPLEITAKVLVNLVKYLTSGSGCDGMQVHMRLASFESL